MEALYHQTNKLVQDTQGCFQMLERCVDSEADGIEREIQARIDSITSNCERLDIFVHKEPLTRRQASKTRVEQLKYDNQHLQAALRMLQHKRQRREVQYLEREELFNRKFTALKDEDTAIIMDYSLQHQNSLQRANKGIDEMLYTGNNVLGNLRDQRATLKGAQRRIMDIANTLGLSNATMRLIENRVKQDKWILLGGMFVTLLIIFFVLIYVKT